MLSVLLAAACVVPILVGVNNVDMQGISGSDFQSKRNVCEQKASCGHFQPRCLRGLRLSMA